MTVLRSLPPLGPKCASRLHGTSFRLRVSDLYRGVYAASGRQPNADEVWTWSCESRGRYDYLSYCDDRGTHRCARVTHGARGAQMIGGFGALIRAQEKSLSLRVPHPFILILLINPKNWVPFVLIEGHPVIVVQPVREDERRSRPCMACL